MCALAVMVLMLGMLVVKTDEIEHVLATVPWYLIIVFGVLVLSSKSLLNGLSGE